MTRYAGENTIQEVISKTKQAIANGKDIQWVTTSNTFAQVTAWVNANKLLAMKVNDIVYTYQGKTGGEHWFVSSYTDGLGARYYELFDDDTWTNGFTNTNITSTPTSGSNDLITSGGVYTALSNKQDTLTSGTNIKTINSQSLLGSGNITVGGGTDVQVNGTSITSNDVANIVTNTAYNASTNKIATMSDIPAVITSVNGLSGGSLTSPLVITGGDAATAAKLALDQTASGQITDGSTGTLFGFLSNNATTLTVGSNSYALNLRGSGTRPQYKGNNLAMYSDLPTVPTTLPVTYVTTAPTAVNTSGLKVALLDSEPATKYDGWIYLIKE